MRVASIVGADPARPRRYRSSRLLDNQSPPELSVAACALAPRARLPLLTLPPPLPPPSNARVAARARCTTSSSSLMSLSPGRCEAAVALDECEAESPMFGGLELRLLERDEDEDSDVVAVSRCS
jgi:hypothetical protein